MAHRAGPRRRIFDALLFAKVRQGVRRPSRILRRGGALLDAELQRFFYAIGIPMFQDTDFRSDARDFDQPPNITGTGSDRRQDTHSAGPKILDEEGREVPHGQKGEIVVRARTSWPATGESGPRPKPCATGAPHGRHGLSSRRMISLYVLGRSRAMLIASDGEKYSPKNGGGDRGTSRPTSTRSSCTTTKPVYGAIVVPTARPAPRCWRPQDARSGSAQTSQRRFSAPRSTVPRRRNLCREFPERGCLRDCHCRRGFHGAERIGEQHDESCAGRSRSISETGIDTSIRPRAAA